MKIEGETIPGSNISDLVSDAMRSRRNFNPTGAKEFFEALNKLNVPKDLVRNEERWKEVWVKHQEQCPLPNPQYVKFSESDVVFIDYAHTFWFLQQIY